MATLQEMLYGIQAKDKAAEANYFGSGAMQDWQQALMGYLQRFGYNTAQPTFDAKSMLAGIPAYDAGGATQNAMDKYYAAVKSVLGAQNPLADYRSAQDAMMSYANPYLQQVGNQAGRLEGWAAGVGPDASYRNAMNQFAGSTMGSSALNQNAMANMGYEDYIKLQNMANQTAAGAMGQYGQLGVGAATKMTPEAFYALSNQLSGQQLSALSGLIGTGQQQGFGQWQTGADLYGRGALADQSNQQTNYMAYLQQLQRMIGGGGTQVNMGGGGGSNQGWTDPNAKGAQYSANTPGVIGGTNSWPRIKGITM